jgi:hypothetical protein
MRRTNVPVHARRACACVTMLDSERFLSGRCTCMNFQSIHTRDCACRYGYQPHRIAFWIYLHAVLLLLRKGAPLFGRPDPAFRERVEAKAKELKMQKTAEGQYFVWRDALKPDRHTLLAFVCLPVVQDASRQWQTAYK